MVAQQLFIPYPFYLMDDNNAPATKVDINKLYKIVERTDASNKTLQSMMVDLAKNLSTFQKNVEQRFDQVDRRMDQIEGRIDQANERISQVLTLASNMDHRMNETFKDHDRRIQRLEQHVGLAT